MNTCRFCGRHTFDRGALVKYGVRHYAHPACYLAAVKPLADLHAWQVGEFPYRLLLERGLLGEAERILADQAKRDARRELCCMAYSKCTKPHIACIHRVKVAD